MEMHDPDGEDAQPAALAESHIYVEPNSKKQQTDYDCAEAEAFVLEAADHTAVEGSAGLPAYVEANGSTTTKVYEAATRCNDVKLFPGSIGTAQAKSNALKSARCTYINAGPNAQACKSKTLPGRAECIHHACPECSNSKSSRADACAECANAHANDLDC